MTLCFGVFAHVLRLCKRGAVTATALVEKIINTITVLSPADLSENRYYAYHILSCSWNLSNGEKSEESNRVTNIAKEAPTARREDVAARLKETVLPLLDADRYGEIVSSLMDIVRRDESIGYARKNEFVRFNDLPKEAFLRTETVELSHFLAGLLLYAVNATENREGASCVKEIDRDFLAQCAAGDFARRILVGDARGDEAVRAYLRRVQSEVTRVKTLIYKTEPAQLTDFYVPGDIAQRDTGRIWRSLDAQGLFTLPKQSVLVGTGGIGKSCMLRYMALLFCDAYADRGILPLFAELRDYAGEPLEEYILRETAPELSADELKERLENGTCALLFDALDEIHSAHQASFAKELARLLRGAPEIRCVISSRPMRSVASMRLFTELALLPFSKRQSVKMIRMTEYPGGDKKLKERFLKELNGTLYDSHKPFAENPLLLTIMFITFETCAKVPQETHKFFEEAYDALSVRHDQIKGYHDRPFRTGLGARQLAACIGLFCAFAYGEQKADFSDADCERYHALIRARRQEIQGGFEDFLHDMTANLCLMYREGQKYRFLHRSFQEYFAAACFASQMEKGLESVRKMMLARPAYMLFTDQVLLFLRQIDAEKVERYLFLPTLKEMLPDYETFLCSAYPFFTYAIGETAEYAPTEAGSYLYAFLRREYMEEEIVLSGFPMCERLIEEAFVRDADGNIAPAFEGEENGQPVGWVLSSKMRDIFDEPEAFSDVIGALKSPACPLMREYEAVRAYRERLERAHRESGGHADFRDIR